MVSPHSMPGDEPVSGGEVRTRAVEERAVVEGSSAAHRAIVAPTRAG